MPIKGFFEEVGEKALEQGQQAVSGMAQSAKQQLGVGGKPAGGKPAETGGSDNTGSEHFAQMLGDLQKKPPDQIAQANKNDVIHRVQEASQVRAKLKAEQIRKQQLTSNYNQIQRSIEEVRAKKDEQERQKQAEEIQKDKQEDEGKVMQEEKKKSILSPFTNAMKGSREQGKMVAG